MRPARVYTVFTIQFNAINIMNPLVIEPSVFYRAPAFEPQLISQLPPPPRPLPQSTKASHSTRDQRRDIRLLHDIGWSYKQISEQLDFHPTFRQIKYAVKDPVRATPKKKTGRNPVLTQAQVEDLVFFVCASAQNRRMSYAQLAEVMDFGVRRWAIRSALLREGFYRRLAMRKPPISEANRKIRLAWAKEHVKWTIDQWYRILWTDETWITGGRHTRTWVTRRPGEEWDPTCIVERHQKKKGWMFWGCFHGHTKGPGIFWEKDWGSIGQESYCQYTVPIIHRYIELCRREGIELVLMQDGAPGHAAGETKQDLAERGIIVIFWPAFSPDLNPIKRV